MHFFFSGEKKKVPKKKSREWIMYLAVQTVLPRNKKYYIPFFKIVKSLWAASAVFAGLPKQESRT